MAPFDIDVCIRRDLVWPVIREVARQVVLEAVKS